ncbi:MAG: TolC family protein [Synergistaceae bacterium]|nr:TolC family protein [Synergistaceae bacterium]
MLKKFGLLILIIALAAHDAQASVKMKLNDYMREILLNNHELQAGIKSVEAKYYEVLASVSSQRPSFGGALNGVWLSKNDAMGGRNATAGSLVFQLTHRIDISGIYGLSEQQSILGYETARAQFDAGLNALLATAEETWWGAVLARENVKLQQEVLNQRAENHRVTMEKYKQELVPRLDIVRSEAQVVQAESLVKEAETSYQNLLANLSYLAGGLDVEPIEQNLQVPEFDVDIDYDTALKVRPDVRAARIMTEQTKVIKKLRAKGLSPTVDFGFQWSAWADPDTFTTPQKKEVGASITLNMPFFDGNNTKYNVMNSDRLIQQSESNLKDLEEQTRRDIAVALNNWKNASAIEVDRKRQVERAEEELRITELMYTEGMGAQIDLINAQVSYRSVRTEYLSAVQGMYTALVALRKAMAEYAPSEDGSWREAVKRYGKGNNIIGEVGLKSLRDVRLNVK